ASFSQERWFDTVQESRAFHIVPVQPDRPDSVLYVVSPLIKGQEFTGALVGAVDLARGGAIAADKPTSKALTVVAAADGEVVYPPVPPTFSADRGWRALFEKPQLDPFIERRVLEGEACIVAASPVEGTELVLMAVGKQRDLFHDAHERL